MVSQTIFRAYTGSRQLYTFLYRVSVCLMMTSVSSVVRQVVLGNDCPDVRGTVYNKNSTFTGEMNK